MPKKIMRLPSRLLSPLRLVNLLAVLAALLLLLTIVHHRKHQRIDDVSPDSARLLQVHAKTSADGVSSERQMVRKIDEKIQATSTKVVSTTSATLDTTTTTQLPADRLEALERVKNVKLFQRFITDREQQIMLDMLQRIDRVFKHFNVTYIIYGGTLLGSHRHMGLIPWDDDIDLLVNHTCRPHLLQMLASMEPSLKLYEAGGHDKVSHGESRNTNKYPWRWPYLDISYFLENATHIWDHMPTYSHWFVYPKSLVLPVHPRPFEQLWLPAPSDTLAFLQVTYGTTGTCLTSAYSHMIEDGMTSGRKQCSELEATVAFVHRRPVERNASVYGRNASGSTGVREALILAGRVLRTAIVAEPAFAVNDPHSLRLMKGFTQPPHYPAMRNTDL